MLHKPVISKNVRIILNPIIGKYVHRAGRGVGISKKLLIIHLK